MKQSHGFGIASLRTLREAADAPSSLPQRLRVYAMT